MTLVHWDDVEGFDIPDDVQPLGGRWQRLADAAGSVRVGVQRVRLAPEQMITPPHVHSAEQEIFHVTWARRCCGRTARRAEGLTYLAYGTKEPSDVCYYPRSNKIYWRGLGLIARLEPLNYVDGEPG